MKSEARIQQEIVMFFNNEYPELRGCLCYNNNNSVGGLRGKLNKDYQRSWQYLMSQQGFEYYIIRSLEEFKELITKIII